jgi:hypothetical protein
MKNSVLAEPGALTKPSFTTKINMTCPVRHQRIYGEIRKSFDGHGSRGRTKLGTGKNESVFNRTAP